MAKQNWKTPFLELKDKLQPLYETDLRIYHGILMAPFHGSNDVEEVVHTLEAAYEGKRLLCEIKTPTFECGIHAHYFFGNNTGFQQLERILAGIENSIKAIPKKLVPEFNIPRIDNRVRQSLVHWANLVYYLAWEFDTPYLQAWVEYQAEIQNIGFFPWNEWPQPSGCDPRPWLIHQKSTTGTMDEWLGKFSKEDLYFPDIIDAHLCGDPMIGEFIACSITAIDCLVYILEQVRDNEQEFNKGYSKPLRKRPSKSTRIETEEKLLRGFLGIHHGTGNDNYEEARTPLTADEIAIKMEWVNEKGEPLQSKVSRRMTGIFGENAMGKYRVMFQGSDPREGFNNLLNDDSLEVDGLHYDPEPDLD